MKRAFILILVLSAACVFGKGLEPREKILFDDGWRFRHGQIENVQSPAFDDKDWRAVTLPHDWSIEGVEGPNTVKLDGPFDKNSMAGSRGGYLNGGTGWYRKSFQLPYSEKGKRISILFDGAFMNCDVWINGEHLGFHPYGYTSFYYDLTGRLKFGSENVLAVRLRVDQPCSRWYTGAGLYRHVWLISNEDVHAKQWGTYITTPQIDSQRAIVNIQTTACNDSDSNAAATVMVTILDGRGKKAAQGTKQVLIAAGKEMTTEMMLEVSKPKLWSPESPYLYEVVYEIYNGKKLADWTVTPMGIRSVKFTADNGCILNGRRLDIKGVCMHHDLGCLGAAAFRRGIERQLEILRGMGCNAIRTSHNPPSPELLELCDRMGFVVMDEAFDEWKMNKLKRRNVPIEYGYSHIFDEWSQADLESMLRRDHNHPCIVLWSIGNEIFEQAAPEGGARAKRLADICRKEDPSRAVTAGCHLPDDAVKNGFADALDIFGINYKVANYQKYKGRPLIGSETASIVSARGEYNLALNPEGRVEIKNSDHLCCTAYDWAIPKWGSDFDEQFDAQKDAPWVAGQFVWTGFDYLGETFPFEWPVRSASFGIIDTAGFPKDRFYRYKAQWTAGPMVHILPHWNWQQFADKEIPVRVDSNCDSVELLLNGKSLGEKKVRDVNERRLSWSVPFEAGYIKAIGKKRGKAAAEEIVYTAGSPAKIGLSVDRKNIKAGGQDLAFVTVSVLDKNSRVCPEACNRLRFEVQGEGVFAGLDNGDPRCHDFFCGPQYNAFNGLALAVIRSTEKPGGIKLNVSSDGLESASIKLKAE